VERNTSHHFAPSAQYITVRSTTSLAYKGNHHSLQHKNESSPMDCFFVFGTMCSACTERDAHYVRDDGFAL